MIYPVYCPALQGRGWFIRMYCLAFNRMIHPVYFSALRGEDSSGVPSCFVFYTREWFIQCTVPLYKGIIHLVYCTTLQVDDLSGALYGFTRAWFIWCTVPLYKWADSSKCTVLTYLSITIIVFTTITSLYLFGILRFKIEDERGGRNYLGV